MTEIGASVCVESGRKIAVIGGGISGLSAAWLLSKRHDVTLFEALDRLGGHSHTVNVGALPVDTGFIVYNPQTYPNLTALFDHIEVPTQPSDMSFSVSLDGGLLEYSGCGLAGLFAQPSNFVRPRFWSMLRDLLRFYRTAAADAGLPATVPLGNYLEDRGYGEAFRDDHLYPMAAAIWSTPAQDIARHPAGALIRFFENHRLLRLSGHPAWRSVTGGSRVYVEQLRRGLSGPVLCATPVRSVRRSPAGIEIGTPHGPLRVDDVVIATHADEALALLADADAEERKLLGAFAYCHNEAVLHADPSLMPRRRRAWAAWNFSADRRHAQPRASVTYWMNRLQNLPEKSPLFVSLNPPHEPHTAFHRQVYAHPLFDAAAITAQDHLWSLQGRRGTWFCGAYFGAGFHEDGLQAGLAVAEQLGGVRRPWTVGDESGRIRLLPAARRVPAPEMVP